MSWPTYQGGPADRRRWLLPSSALYRSQQAANLRPYKTFSTQAGIPLMLGEWGYPTGSGEQAWMNDFMPTLADVGTVIEIQWNYDVSSSNTDGRRGPVAYGARPSQPGCRWADRPPERTPTGCAGRPGSAELGRRA